MIPDYVVTREESIRLSHGWWNKEIWEPIKDKVKFVGSAYTDHEITDHMKTMGVHPYRYYFPEQEEARNVGLFGIIFAKERLGCDQIFLIGFEHEGAPYDPYIYEQWIRDFWLFVKK